MVIQVTYNEELADSISTQVTEYAANKILDHTLGGTALGTFNTYLGCLSDRSGLANGGQPTNEVSVLNYHRTLITSWTAGTWQVRTDCIISTPANRVTYADPWGDVPVFALFDAEVGGNCWFWALAALSHETTNYSAQTRRFTGDIYNMAVFMKVRL